MKILLADQNNLEDVTEKVIPEKIVYTSETVLKVYSDMMQWIPAVGEEFTLVTPVDKSQNVEFYTERCGFDIQSEEMDGSVKVYRFILRRI